MERENEEQETPRDFVEALTALAEELSAVPGRKKPHRLRGRYSRLPFVEDGAGSRYRRRDLQRRQRRRLHHRRHRRGHQESLAQLAQETGGEYLFRFQDFLDPLRRISRQNSGFYLLSFKSQQPAEGEGYRPVSVRTVSEEFQVRARGGYRYGD